MKVKVMFVSLFVLMLAVSFCSCSFCMGRSPMDRGRGEERMIKNMAKELNLTDKQKSNFLEKTKKAEEEARDIQKNDKELFAKIEVEMQKDAPDASLINKYVTEIGNNKTKVQIKRMNVMLELRKELTPDQLIKFKKMHKYGKERFEERKGRMKDLRNKK